MIKELVSLEVEGCLTPLSPFLGIYLANIPARTRDDKYNRILTETLLIRENKCQ